MTSLAITNSLDKITELGSQNGTRKVESGTILFVVRGMSLKSEFRVGVAQRTVAFNQDLKAIIPDGDLLPSFLGLYLQFLEPTVLKLVDEAGHGTGRLPTDRIAAVEVPIPPLAEQRAIAAALSDMDSLIAAQEKLIAKKRDIKTATMQQLLTGRKRLPGFGESMGCAQTELGLLPEDWSVQRLGYYVNLKSGRHLLAHQYNSIGLGEPYLTGPSDFEKDNVVVSKWTEQQGVKATIGDILVTVKGSGSGGCFWMGLPGAVISRQLMAVSSSGLRLNQRFLYFSLKANEWELAAKATGNLIPGLSRPDILNLRLAVPPLPEQKAIAQVLSDMDAEITALETRLAKLRDIKQGMMQELLTGRTRLV